MLRRLSPILILLTLAAGPATRPAPATRPTVEFLDGDAAKAALVDDSADPYFSILCDHEMSAKTGKPITGNTPAEKIAECKKRYQSAVMDFTADDKLSLSWFVGKFQPELVRDYPVFGNTPWSFIKVADTLEGGMPHTRGGHIVVSRGFVSQMKMLKQRGPDASLTLGTVLVHEQTHVLERQHPELFTPLYTDVFHFIHAKQIRPDPWLKSHQLVNPDGTVCDWVYPLTEDGKQTYILPLIAFNNLDAGNMRSGMGTIAVTVKPDADGYKVVTGGDGNPVVRPLEELEDYVRAVGTRQDDYHPNEIAADRFARLVAWDYFVDKKRMADQIGPERVDKMEGDCKQIRDWAKTAFAEKAK